MQTPLEFYGQEKTRQQEIWSRLKKKRSRLGTVRLAVFILTVFICYQVFVQAGLWGLLPLVVGLGTLLYLVSLDVNNNQKISHQEVLLSIIDDEISVLQHQYTHRYDGASFHIGEHPYANDLDLFGHASLFQWMNRCSTEQGHTLLASNLLAPLSPEAAQQRQEAVKELALMVGERQELQAFTQKAPLSLATEKKVAGWISEEDRHFRSGGWKWFVNLYSLFTVGLLMAAIIGLVPFSVVSSLYGLFFFTSVVLSRNTVKPYILLSGVVKEVTALHRAIHWIEQRSFRAPHLQQLQQELKGGGSVAAGEIRSLGKILDRFDLRLSIVGLLLFNPFLLWDVRQMIALNEWRKKNRGALPRWFSAIAEMEVLHTLATLSFNHPQWTFPGFSPEHFTLEGKSIGHPLIPQKARVVNDFAINGQAKVGLITGSNMAGKSTFLRSLGVNIVLAQAGAPVCAGAFRLSPVMLMSSMRIADNLAENTSTFYAELKKLKTIIDAVNRGEQIFILLDEILRGTNSLDRHTGSEALIHQLIRKDAVALIATHDVELARLHDQYPQALVNYHFDVQVEGEELYFDYKLKEGICQSLNASILMRKIGIEMN